MIRSLTVLAALLVGSLASAADPASPDAVSRAAAAVTARFPDRARGIRTVATLPTRSGGLRIVGVTPDADLDVVHLDLALRGSEPVELRVARVKLAAVTLDEPEVLDAFLASAGPDLRAALLAGFAREDSVATGRALVRGLSDPDATVREVAVSVLGRRPDHRQHTRDIAQAATDEAWMVRRLAIRALGWSGDVRYRGIVRDALADPEPSVRQAAQRALERLGG